MKDAEPRTNTPHGQVHINIDKGPYESPSPTTGAALYSLGGIAADHQLYRRLPGNDADEPVFNTADSVVLHNGDHFYSDPKPFRGYVIFVNTRKKTVQKKVLSFEEVVALAFDTPPPTGPNIVISVSFRNADGERREGTLQAGDFVTIKNGTIFDVTATDRS
jgi:hypothetical protein